IFMCTHFFLIRVYPVERILLMIGFRRKCSEVVKVCVCVCVCLCVCVCVCVLLIQPLFFLLCAFCPTFSVLTVAHVGSYMSVSVRVCICVCVCVCVFVFVCEIGR